MDEQWKTNVDRAGCACMGAVLLAGGIGMNFPGPEGNWLLHAFFGASFGIFATLFILEALQ